MATNIQIPIGTRDALLNVYKTRADAGTGAATLKIYTGSAPGPDAAATGTLLVTLTLNDPAFTGPTAQALTVSTSPAISATATAAGTAGWGRLADSSGATVFDGAVTATGGNGAFELNSTTISSGQTVNLTGGTVTQPAS